MPEASKGLMSLSIEPEKSMIKHFYYFDVLFFCIIILDSLSLAECSAHVGSKDAARIIKPSTINRKYCTNNSRDKMCRLPFKGKSN